MDMNQGQGGAGVAAPAHEGSSGGDVEGVDLAVGDNQKEGEPKEKPKVPRKFRYKPDDAAEEVELDEKEVIAAINKRKASDQKFNEAALMRKQALELVEKLRDPKELRKILSDPRIGHKDVKKLLEQMLTEDLEQELMDPKDRELKELREEKERRQRETEEAEHRAKVEKFSKQYTEGFQKALEANDLPRYGKAGEVTVRRIANYMYQAFEVHKVEITPMEAAELVKEDMRKEAEVLFKEMTAEQFIATYGEGMLKKLREYDMKKLKSQRGAVSGGGQRTGAGQSGGSREKKWITKDEWKARLAKIE